MSTDTAAATITAQIPGKCGEATSKKTSKKALSNKPAKLVSERTLRTVFGSNADQFLLNAIKESCYGAFSLPTFDQTLQKIKSHFFDRDYDAVFQNPDHLPVYSARYAPSRALCYYHLFLDHPILLKPLEGGPSTILCIGAGAGSELMGIAAAMVHVTPLITTVTTTRTKKPAADDISSGSKGKEQIETTHSRPPFHASEFKEASADATKQAITSIETATTTTTDLYADASAAAPIAAAHAEVILPASSVPTATLPNASSSISGGSDNADIDSRNNKTGSKAGNDVDALAESLPRQLDFTSSDPSAASGTTATNAIVEKKVKTKKPKKHQVTVVLQDYVDWSGILNPMQEVIQSRMNLPRDRLKVETEVNNILDLDPNVLARVAEADLITFLFVLNELFQDKKRTMLLVAKVVAAMRPGSHMLVADSAGSFSNLKVGERTYMVYMMLDHLQDLEVVYKDDATWYRCPSNVTYPLKLENMRHFVRIYKKL